MQGNPSSTRVAGHQRLAIVIHDAYYISAKEKESRAVWRDHLFVRQP